MPRRPVKRLRGYGGGLKYVDEGIRGLVRDLNVRGYRTTSSCEGDAYLTGEISFAHLSPPISQEEEDDIRDIIRANTDVPFRFDRDRGKVVGVAFRKPLRGPLDLSDLGRDTRLYDMIGEGEGGGASEEGLKAFILDDTKWER